MEPLNVWDYERLAAERLEAGAHGYYAGGAGDEVTLRDNVDAYRRWILLGAIVLTIDAPVRGIGNATFERRSPCRPT